MGEVCNSWCAIGGRVEKQEVGYESNYIDIVILLEEACAPTYSPHGRVVEPAFHLLLLLV